MELRSHSMSGHEHGDLEYKERERTTMISPQHQYQLSAGSAPLLQSSRVWGKKYYTFPMLWNDVKADATPRSEPRLRIHEDK
jgi:hypothetical protein